MNEKEKIIHLWFQMWLEQKDLGIDFIFAEDVVYTESWSPKYENRETVKHWFFEWNQRGKVLLWHIDQFLHQDCITIVKWKFKSQMDNGQIDEFNGLSWITWTEDNKIQSVTEYGCNCNTYNPYADGDIPQFHKEDIKWF